MNRTQIIQKTLLIILLLATSITLQAQNNKGKLFIIGGGNRDDSLMSQLIKTAYLEPKDYITVLPMASEEPDSSYYYFKKQLIKLTTNKIIMMNFDATTAQNKTLTDSLQKAKIIFICGGDQTRFMNIVLNTPIYDAIHKAFQNGSTLAGTSAGAAVMCEHMITGNQKLEVNYTETFDSIRFDNLETFKGLGLIKNVIIDQHFLKRSRYNRLISGLIEFPNHIGIGIDESTAILVQNNQFEVIGESQVVVVSKPKGITKITKNNLISVKKLQMRILVEGEKFNIK